MKHLKIGIAGAGGQGRKHLLNCLRLKNTKVIGVADRSKTTLSTISRLGIKTYEDYREMITKEKPDAVIVALPNDLHAQCCVIASESGCDILVEKPLARNTKEGKHVADHARKTGVKLMVGMCHRFITDCRKLKEEIDTGTLGRIDFASALYFTGPFTSGKQVPEWMFDPAKMGGGALLDCGCHIIDLLLWYFGAVQSVNGHTESLLNLGYDDYAEVHIKFRNGVDALAVVSWRSRIPCYRVEVAGEYGRRIALSKKFGIFDFGVWRGLRSFVWESISQRIKGRPFLPLGDDIYYRELDYFVRCVLNNEEPKPNADDWLRTSEIIDLVYQKDKSRDVAARAKGKIKENACYGHS